jgi:hypothetical protein
MSDLILISKPKAKTGEPAPAISMVVRQKSAPVPTAPVKKDDDGGDDEMMMDSMPSCPKCLKSDDVLGVKFHPLMTGNGMAGSDGGNTGVTADDSDSPDGYCCTACSFAWPGDASTASQQPARPTHVASLPSQPAPAATPAKTEPAPAAEPKA